MGHRREELALDPIRLPEGRGLDRLSDELLTLRSQVLQLTKQTRHHVGGEDENADVERQAPRLRHKAEPFRPIRGDRDVRE